MRLADKDQSIESGFGSPAVGPDIHEEEAFKSMGGDSAYNLDGPAFPTNHRLHDLDSETMTEAYHSSRKFYAGMLRVFGCFLTCKVVQSNSDI